VLGEIVGNFRIVAKLGRGGMGEVWLAEQLNISTRVAIKMLLESVSADSDEIQRFFNEARAVGRIQHAGIAKIFDVGIHASGRPYLVMELLEGETLARRIARVGRLGRFELAELGRQIASVLEATHSVGITHRDLKPENVFIVPDRELPRGERAKVLDFGIAKLTGTLAGASPGTTGMLGTPAYTAPEQWGDASVVDWRADLYSLGCVLFEMACGRPPFVVATLAEACARHLYDPPPRASSLEPSISPELDRLIDTLLAKKPDDRPRSMHDVVRALEAVARGIDSMAPTMGGSIAIPASTVPRSSRLPIAIGVGIAVVAVAAAGGYTLATRHASVVMSRDAAVAAIKPIDAAVPPADAAIDAAIPVDAAPPRPHVVVHHAPAEELEGTIDTVEVTRLLHSIGAEYNACLKPYADLDPTISGRIVVTFKIGADGRASEMSATGMTDEISGCVMGQIRRIVFPRPVGNPVKIIFPVSFQPHVGSNQR
jgi:hypothetical protein